MEISTLATKQELKLAVEHLDKERRRSSSALYETLDKLEKATADRHAENEGTLNRLEERTETHIRQLAAMETKLDLMPQRIIAMLPPKSRP